MDPERSEEPRSRVPARPVVRSSAFLSRPALLILLLLTAILLALRLIHIHADFPTYHFYSQERARFTDEGFYTSAALHYFTLGQAYIPGGWNPGVFMPIWPLLVGVLFHFTGVSVAAARSLAVGCTWLSVLLVYAVTRQYRSRTFACWTSFLVAANALGFFYGRLALLEPAQVLLLLLAIYLAGRVRPGMYGLAVAVGFAFVAATLTKSSTAFLLPAALYPVWAQNQKTDRRAAWKLIAVALGTIFLLLGSARLIWLGHYAGDASVILYMRPIWQVENSPLRLLRFFFRGTWIDPVLFPLALAALIAALTRMRFLWRDNFFTMAFLWEAGYATFIVYHYDGPPRYFVTLIVPTVWLALLIMESIWRRHRRAGMTLAVCIALSVLWNIAAISNYLLHPRYTLMNASLEIRRTISAQQTTHPGTNSLLIGRGADEVSLFSGGLAAIDSDGTMPLAEKLNVYRPGWFMAWSSDPPLRTAIVARNRRMVERQRFSDLDPDRHAGIVLYQLFPRSSN
ncbi:MAG: glycosyltransferase family 39 protein [Acidobacteriaceae bacterium]